jgi:hypothetical protein
MYARAFENPSKAFNTLMAAKRKHGGWAGVNYADESFTIVILAGKYTGSYALIGGPKIAYEPKLFAILPGTTDAGPSRAAPLVRWRENKISSLTQPYFDLLWPIYCTRETEDEKIAHARRLEDWERWEDKWEKWADQEEGIRGSFIRAMRGEKGERPKFTPWEPSTGTERAVRELAALLYILSQSAGVPFAEIKKQLVAQPKRAYGLFDFAFGSAETVPGNARERTCFSKNFLRTWSVNKARKAVCPNIEGRPPAVMPESQPYALIKYAFNYVPSWKQVARRSAPLYANEEDRESEGTDRILHVAKELKKEGIRAPEFRKLLRGEGAGIQLLERLRDSLRLLDPGTMQVLAESEEGRRVIRDAERRDWRRVARHHDFLVAFQRERRREIRRLSDLQALKKSEEFHVKSRDYTLIPGVRALCTQADFDAEGDEMDHCVAGYFRQVKAHIFAFRGPEGCTATLEVSPKGAVWQFRSYQNAPVDQECRAMLKKFMVANKAKFSAAANKNPQNRTRSRRPRRRR